MNADLHPRLADWQTYGRTSEATLGNAAWKILAGRIDPAGLAVATARCAHCRRLTPGQGHLVSCWHQAAALLFEQGLQPLEDQEEFDRPTAADADSPERQLLDAIEADPRYRV
jgi:hypothetical protein